MNTLGRVFSDYLEEPFDERIARGEITGVNLSEH